MKSYVASGMTLLMVGVVSYGLASLIFFKALDKQRADDEKIARIEQSCRDQILKFGKVQPGADGVLEIDMGEVKDPRKAMGDASAVLAMCPTKKILSACMGISCSAPVQGMLNPPVKMILKLGNLKPGENG